MIFFTRTLMVEKTGAARFFGLLKPKAISVRRDDDSRLAIWKDDARSLPKHSITAACYSALIRLGGAMMGRTGTADI
jgi:hypothetical protein